MAIKMHNPKLQKISVFYDLNNQDKFFYLLINEYKLLAQYLYALNGQHVINCYTFKQLLTGNF